MSMQELAEETFAETADFLPLNGTDHVEFYVANARQAAYYYRAAFGMQLTAYSGPETGNHQRASYVVTQASTHWKFEQMIDFLSKDATIYPAT